MLRRSLIETTQVAKILREHPQSISIVNANFPINWKNWVVRPLDEYDHVFKNERIPTARHININLLTDKSKNLPAMMPTLDHFIQVMKELDIGKNDHIVCYGDDTIVGAARAWWMFKVFGCKNVQVMNGKFNKWKKEGNKVETGEEAWKKHKRERSSNDFSFDYNKSLITSMEEIQQLLEQNRMNNINLVDARPEEMFKGASHPKFGHIPGAKNLPLFEFLDMENDEVFKKTEELTKIVKEKNIDLNKPIKTMCRAGITANVLNMGFTELGIENISLYDGSWSEWIKSEKNPIERNFTN